MGAALALALAAPLAGLAAALAPLAAALVAGLAAALADVDALAAGLEAGAAAPPQAAKSRHENPTARNLNRLLVFIARHYPHRSAKVAVATPRLPAQVYHRGHFFTRCQGGH
jgi:hypothetical protein